MKQKQNGRATEQKTIAYSKLFYYISKYFIWTIGKLTSGLTVAVGRLHFPNNLLRMGNHRLKNTKYIPHLNTILLLSCWKWYYAIRSTDFCTILALNFYTKCYFLIFFKNLIPAHSPKFQHCFLVQILPYKCSNTIYVTTILWNTNITSIMHTSHLIITNIR